MIAALAKASFVLDETRYINAARTAADFVLKAQYLPNIIVSLKKNNEMSYEKIEGKATAHVCCNKTCMPPPTKLKNCLRFLEKACNKLLNFRASSSY